MSAVVTIATRYVGLNLYCRTESLPWRFTRRQRPTGEVATPDFPILI
jgi:hypothetical protein